MIQNPEQDPGLNRFELGPVSGRIFELRGAWRVAAEFDEAQTETDTDKLPEPSSQSGLFAKKSETPVRSASNTTEPKRSLSPVDEARNHINRVRQNEDTIDDSGITENSDTLKDAA